MPRCLSSGDARVSTPRRKGRASAKSAPTLYVTYIITLEKLRFESLGLDGPHPTLDEPGSSPAHHLRVLNNEINSSDAIQLSTLSRSVFAEHRS